MQQVQCRAVQFNSTITDVEGPIWCICYRWIYVIAIIWNKGDIVEPCSNGFQRTNNFLLLYKRTFVIGNKVDKRNLLERTMNLCQL